MPSCNYLFKTIVVGDTRVGKSSLLLQFTNSHFQRIHNVTVGVRCRPETILIGDKLIKLYLCDTAGQKGYTRSYYRQAVAALLVYDVTRRETFNQLDSSLKDIREHADANVTIVLVGNKCDVVRRQVSSEEGEEFAEENGLIFFETSAKMALNVDEVFEELGKSICQKIDDGVFDLSNECSGIRKGNSDDVNGDESDDSVSSNAKNIS